MWLGAANASFNDIVTNIIDKGGTRAAQDIHMAKLNRQFGPGEPYDINRRIQIEPYVGWTLLMAASAMGQPWLVEQLVSNYNADKSLKNREGKTALDLAREALAKETRFQYRPGREGVVEILERR